MFWTIPSLLGLVMFWPISASAREYHNVKEGDCVLDTGSGHDPTSIPEGVLRVQKPADKFLEGCQEIRTKLKGDRCRRLFLGGHGTWGLGIFQGTFKKTLMAPGVWVAPAGTESDTFRHLANPKRGAPNVVSVITRPSFQVFSDFTECVNQIVEREGSVFFACCAGTMPAWQRYCSAAIWAKWTKRTVEFPVQGACWSEAGTYSISDGHVDKVGKELPVDCQDRASRYEEPMETGRTFRNIPADRVREALSRRAEKEPEQEITFPSRVDPDTAPRGPMSFDAMAPGLSADRLPASMAPSKRAYDTRASSRPAGADPDRAPEPPRRLDPLAREAPRDERAHAQSRPRPLPRAERSH